MAVERDTERAAADKELTGSMGLGKQMLAGAGKAFSDLGGAAKRVANMAGVGGYDQSAAQADAALDRPLMATGGGLAGNIAGEIALTAVPGYRAQQGLTRAMRAAAAGPGVARGVATTVAPYLAAAGAGAGVGAATNPADMAHGATVGGAAGTLGEVVGRAAPAVWNAGKALFIEPFSQTGRQRILKRVKQFREMYVASNLSEVWHKMAWAIE